MRSWMERIGAERNAFKVGSSCNKKNRFSNANCLQFNLIILLKVLHVIIHILLLLSVLCCSHSNVCIRTIA